MKNKNSSVPRMDSSGTPEELGCATFKRNAAKTVREVVMCWATGEASEENLNRSTMCLIELKALEKFV